MISPARCPVEVETHIKAVIIRKDGIVWRCVYHAVIISSLTFWLGNNLIRQCHSVASVERPSCIHLCPFAEFLSRCDVELVTVVEHVVVPLVMHLGKISL